MSRYHFEPFSFVIIFVTKHHMPEMLKYLIGSRVRVHKNIVFPKGNNIPFNIPYDVAYKISIRVKNRLLWVYIGL